MSTEMPCELRRHYTELSVKDTDEVIAKVADLIVSYIRQRGRSAAAVAASAGDGGSGQIAEGVGREPTDE